MAELEKMKELRKEITKFDFRKYYPWEKRNKIENINFPGVYAIAITDKNLDDCDVVDYSEMVYIGQTKQSLKKRLNQFNNAIKEGKKGYHIGGRTVHRDLGDYQNGSGWGDKKLFVAVMPIKCNTDKETRTPDDLRKMGQAAYLEYEAFAQFKESPKTNEKPKYNKNI